MTDSFDQSQLSVVLDPNQYIVGIGLPDVEGNAQMVYFRHTSLFDEQWHKVTLSVTTDRAVLWVDCIQVQGVRGEYFEALLPRKAFDRTGGHIAVSRSINQINQPFVVPVSFNIHKISSSHVNQLLILNTYNIFFRQAHW